MRFLGNIEAKTDDKGRAFLPSSFRKVLASEGEETVVMRLDVFESLLVIYPERVWNELMDGMRQRLSRWDRRQQMAFRTFVSNVVELNIDSNGRILIPKAMLQAAGIKQAIRFVGMGDTIEIWNNEPDAEQPVMSKEDFSKMIEQLDDTKPIQKDEANDSGTAL